MNIDAHQVADKLWVGSTPAPEVCKHFDAIVLAAAEKQHLVLRGCHIVKAPLDDAEPTQREINTAVSAARTVHVLRKRGKKVLVTCNAGVNRSSLIAALALILAGNAPAQAIRQVRTKRKPPIGMIPLSNPYFERLIYRLGRKSVVARQSAAETAAGRR